MRGGRETGRRKRTRDGGAEIGRPRERKEASDRPSHGRAKRKLRRGIEIDERLGRGPAFCTTARGTRPQSLDEKRATRPIPGRASLTGSSRKGASRRGHDRKTVGAQLFQLTSTSETFPKRKHHTPLTRAAPARGTPRSERRRPIMVRVLQTEQGLAWGAWAAGVGSRRGGLVRSVSFRERPRLRGPAGELGGFARWKRQLAHHCRPGQGP